MSSSSFRWSSASLLMVAGGAITVVGYFLPWAGMSASVFGQSAGRTVNGYDTLVLLLGMLLVAGGAAYAYNRPQFQVLWIGVAAVAALAILLMLKNLADINNASSALSVTGITGLSGLVGLSGLGVSSNVSVEIGFWLALAGPIVALGGAYLGRSRPAPKPATPQDAPIG